MASFSDVQAECPFTEEETTAYRETNKLLLESGFPPDKIAPRELFLVVMNCKLRPESAAEKYKKWLEAMSDYGINSFDGERLIDNNPRSI